MSLSLSLLSHKRPHPMPSPTPLTQSKDQISKVRYELAIFSVAQLAFQKPIILLGTRLCSHWQST